MPNINVTRLINFQFSRFTTGRLSLVRQYDFFYFLFFIMKVYCRFSLDEWKIFFFLVKINGNFVTPFFVPEESLGILLKSLT